MSDAGQSSDIINALRDIRKDMKSTGVEKIWSIATRAAVPVIIAACGILISHEVRIGGIESNRFTDQDAHAMERRMLEQIPPKWLRDQVTEIKVMIKSIDDRVRSLESKED